MAIFQKGRGDWVQYRQLPNLIEVDFHWSEYGQREIPYWETMQEVYLTALQAIESAHESGKTRYVMFTHGCSTSGPFKQTARSMVRGLMRDKEATPYINRKECIQHESVFVASIRPRIARKETAP